MAEDGVPRALCAPKIVGGWRTNQYDAGRFGVYLAIPRRGRINFGIPRPVRDPRDQALGRGGTAATSRRPDPAKEGPLIGEWVAIMGEPSNGALAHELAAAGARFMAGVGKSTTMLVVADERPFSPGIGSSATYRKAEAMIGEGRDLRILSRSEARALIVP